MKTADTLAKLYTPSGWYPDANRVVKALAQASDNRPERVATIIAALSPQVSVARNLLASVAMLAGASERINGILGASWRNAESDHVGGPKVTAFRANLLGDYHPVTMDVWAWRALGYDIAPDIRRKEGSKLWRQAFTRYRKAASMLGVEPAECQAGVWQSIRVSVGYRFVTNPTLGAELAKLAEPIPERYSVGHWAYTTQGANNVQALASKATKCL